MSKLRFSVVACTSEDSAFPVSELDEHATNSRGYMTAKNCSFPQELVLQMQEGLCRITQVQLLSHQTHIATKMELFVSSSFSYQDTSSFSRLGYLTLKSNTESNYMARELKTVHIDQEAVLIKLRIHNCHVNEHNVYNQVGIMAVNLCGEPLELLPSHSAVETLATGAHSRQQVKKKNGTDSPSLDMRFDAKTAAKIREIQKAKDQAVINEDYDQAKRLKQMEEQLKSIGLQLARLEAQKREAVANEDYDLAKKVKLEIGRLGASIGGNELQPIVPMPVVANSPARSQVMPRSEAVHRSSSSFSPRDMYPEVLQAAKSGSLHGSSNGGGSMRHSSQVSSSGGKEQDPRSGGNANEEDDDGESVNPHFRDIPGAANLPDPEEIPAALVKESEELISIIGSFFTRCFYSNLWNHRDAAIRKVTMEMDNYPVDPMRLLEVCSTLAQSGAGDRIAQVALSAFGLLDRMVSFGARVDHDNMCRILGNSMTQLVNKLGESQAKVRDEAGTVLGHLAAAKNVGVAFVVSHLTKRPKKPLGLKHLQGRLLMLKKLLADFDLIPESDFSAPGIMAFLEDCNCLAHQSREIRDVGKDITVSLYLAVGTEVEGYLKSLRPKQLEEYRAAFEAAETAKASTCRGDGSTATTDRGSVARRDDKPRETQVELEREVEDAIDSEDEESVDEYTCPFCGVVDEKFDSDYLDQHFWGSCKMLTPCKMCGQVIEISTLNEHLLAECEMHQNHRECPRCGEAITTKFFERHVSLNDCPPRAPLNRANRCPLCHDDIAAGKKGWRRHLLDEGCPNNPRN